MPSSTSLPTLRGGLLGPEAGQCQPRGLSPHSQAHPVLLSWHPESSAEEPAFQSVPTYQWWPPEFPRHGTQPPDTTHSFCC